MVPRRSDSFKEDDSCKNLVSPTSNPIITQDSKGSSFEESIIAAKP